VTDGLVVIRVGRCWAPPLLERVKHAECIFQPVAEGFPPFERICPDTLNFRAFGLMPFGT